MYATKVKTLHPDGPLILSLCACPISFGNNSYTKHWSGNSIIGNKQHIFR